MAAGVSAVQAQQIRDGGSEKIDTNYLTGSHFTIAQDDAITQHSFKSIFKRDYPPWPIDSRPQGSKPPDPADVMHKDERRFNDKCSETAQAYEPIDLPKPTHTGPPIRLGATNFKMDADTKKFNSFQTTHTLDYPPKKGEPITRGKPKRSPMLSCIPQGDQEKASDPISDYKDRYRMHDLNKHKPEKVDAPQHLGPPTIMGDNRQHHFDTTHQSAYTGTALPRVQPIPASNKSSIPQGDPNKELRMITVHQDSYPAQDPNLLQKYDRNAVMGKLQTTNFNQNDGQGSWNDYLSEQVDAYRPVVGHVAVNAPGKHRNHSDFPPGDTNPHRETDRVNLTNYRFYHCDPPPTVAPKIESGKDKRTFSQVVFGEPSLGGEYYDTTMQSTFKPVRVPYTYNRSNFHSDSAIPLKYYENEHTFPTTWSDFQDPCQRKLTPNQEAIDSLRASHIMPPQKGERWFSTEHTDQYTPKKTTTTAMDPGRLQRSSVPLGTMGQAQ